MPTFTGTDKGETINGTNDADVIEGGGGDDVINGLGGDDLISDVEGSDRIDGGAGNDTISLIRPDWRSTGTMTIAGGDGNDSVSIAFLYETSPIYVDLGAGDDHLFFKVSTLDNTFLTLGSGVDTIHFDSQSDPGRAQIMDFDAGPGGDVIDMAAYLDYNAVFWDPATNPFDPEGPLRLVAHGANTALEYSSSSGPNYSPILIFRNTTPGEFVAENFSGFNPAGTPGVDLTGTAGADTLVGTVGDDTLIGLAGNDTLRGNSGKDTLYGGIDNDLLEGGRGDDVLYGDAGNDTLIDGAGASTLYGEDGDDSFQLTYFSGSIPTSPLNTIYGGAGNDTLLVASTDNSILVADMGAGDDRITFELMPYTANLTLGSGADVVALTNYEPTNPLVFTDFQTGAGGDRFVFAELASRYTGEPESAANPFAYGYASLVQDGAHTRLVDFYGITYALFQNTTVASFTAANFDADPQAPMAPGITLTGTGVRDDLRGTPRSDVLDGGGGDDLIGGGDSDDQLSGGSGNDWIQGSVGNDVISGGDGEDTIDGGSGADVINAGAGNDTITYHDSLDTIDGGAGYDTLDFGSFGLGGDVSMALDFDLTGYATTGVFRMGGHEVTGIESLFFFLYGTVGGDTIDFDAGATTGVRFEALYGDDALYGTAGQDSLDGEEGNDTLLGRAGDDNLNGGFGNDTLDGGTGADTMVGGAGNDNYVVDNAGDIVVESAGAGNDNVQATVSYALSASADIQLLWASATIPAAAINLTGNGLAQTIVGNEAANVLSGLGGNDTLRGGDGDDSLDGGTGADTMTGGTGDDRFYVDDLDDVVVEGAGGGTDTVIVSRAYYVLGASAEVERMETFDPLGTTAVTLVANAFGQTLVGNAGVNELYGGGSSDTLLAGAGNDTLSGYEGNDQLRGEDGDDNINGGAGNDDIHGGNGNDTIGGDGFSAGSFGEGNDLLDGGAGNDRITGGGADDTLFGGDGNDELRGEAGRDTLEGGEGDDWIDGFGSREYGAFDTDVDALSGGAGNDRLYAGYGDGVDGGAGTDTLSLSFLKAPVGVSVDLTQLAGNGSITIGGGVITGIEYIGNIVLTAFADTIVAGTPVPGNGIDIFGQGGNDDITGSAGSEHIYGGDGDDVIRGGGGNKPDTIPSGDRLLGEGGNDTIYVGSDSADVHGGAGNDTVYGGAGDDGIYGNEGDDTLDGGGGNDTLSGHAGADILTGGAGADELSGDQGDDSLSGGSGDDILVGRDGADRMDGGLGNDTFDVDNVGDVVIERADEGTNDQVFTSVSFALGADAHVEKLSARGEGGTTAINLAGSDSANVLTGNAGSNWLAGLTGDDVLDGGLGADRMEGGADNDVYYVDNAGDWVIENAGEGTDRVLASISYQLTDNVENLALFGTDDTAAAGNALANALTGNAGNNWLAGLAGDDVLDGRLGADRMEGGADNDTYYVDNAGDWLIENAGEGTDQVLASTSYQLADNVENLTLTVSGDTAAAGNALANVVTGNAGNNWLAGLAGDDVLDGGLGADRMEGGADNDTYRVENAGDWVIENDGEGTDDQVFTSVSFALGADAHVEKLSTSWEEGTTAINLAGSDSANVLTGNAGNNWLAGLAGDDVLDGGLGADRMEGGADNDTYRVDNAGDRVIENAGEGTDDQVFTSVSFALGADAHVEKLSTSWEEGTTAINLGGSDSANVLTGNAGNNWLAGLAGDDVLDGGLGADRMEGGADNDTYHVDNAGDWVIENAGEGTDLVLASISYQLADHVENLTLFGTDDTAAAGNALANVLTGNAGNNWLAGLTGDDVLDGGLGADRMEGGADNDTYYVDNAGDWVIENAGEGTDLVLASITYQVSDHVENLTLTGSGDTAAGGNALANVLTGNDGANWLAGSAGNDVLDGGLGADRMDGGTDNDTYHVDNAGDWVIENAGEGTDLVLASIGYQLADNVENLTLTGSGDTAAGGNALANTLIGNAGANWLAGSAGNDVLDGGLGADRLDGGTDQDTFAFTTALGGGNVDWISDFAAADDTIALDHAVFAGLATGALASGAFAIGAAATEADDRIIYDDNTGALWFDADGLGGVAGAQFATLNAGLTLTSADFLVI